VFRRVAGFAVASGVGIPPMTLQSPSRTSLASRSVPPGRPTTTVPSLRTSSRRIGCPCSAPSPRNPLPGGACSPGVGRRLSPSVGSGRSSSARAPLVPPHLVAGFQSRFGPPAPFPTTLAACSSSDPVECFIHSRPWGSGSRLPVACLRSSGPRTFLPGARPWVRTEVRYPRTGGRVVHQGGSRSVPRMAAAEASTLLRAHHSSARRLRSGSGSPTSSRVVSGPGPPR
jgi:hypothetical protein